MSPTYRLTLGEFEVHDGEGRNLAASHAINGDRDGALPTPTDQGNSKGDLELTQDDVGKHQNQG